MSIKRMVEVFSRSATTEELREAMKELDALQRADRILSALDEAGVDNWEFYDEALEAAGLDEEGNEVEIEIEEEDE